MNYGNHCKIVENNTNKINDTEKRAKENQTGNLVVNNDNNNNNNNNNNK